MELFTAAGKLKKFFDDRRCSMSAQRVMGTHRYDIQVLATLESA
jgi:hypothetical protein